MLKFPDVGYDSLSFERETFIQNEPLILTSSHAKEDEHKRKLEYHISILHAQNKLSIS